MIRIAFFGTPTFAKSCLKQLLQAQATAPWKIICVVTQPDKAALRGQKLHASPVKALALEEGLLVLQPNSLKKSSEEGPAFLQKLLDLKIDLAIVAAYGRIIPKAMLEALPFGFINVHGSLLPRHRGASPIQQSILQGDSKTGVCIMQLVPELDAGAVYSSCETPVSESDTFASLADRLADLGAALLIKTLPAVIERQTPTPQALTGITFAPLIDKAEAQINWNTPAIVIHRQSRAFDPSPGAFSHWNGKRIRFFSPKPLQTQTSVSTQPGTVIVTPDALGVHTQDGILYFQEIQLEGKKRMRFSEAKNGLVFERGTQFN